MRLHKATDPRWTETVLSDFDAFLVDHALCERKASAMAMSLVAHYPDKEDLVLAMVEMAREELDHFQRVYTLMVDRGLSLIPDERDPYVRTLLKEVRDGTDAYFLDRLLVAGVVEARGCERFSLVAAALENGPMKEFYEDIARSEARHHGLFTRLARSYFDASTVETRLDQLLKREAEIVAALPFRAAVH